MSDLEGPRVVHHNSANLSRSILKIPGNDTYKDTKKNSKSVTFDQQVETELLKRGKASKQINQEKQKYTVNPYTLRLSDPVMELEFLSYLRMESQSHAKYIVITLNIYSFFLFCQSMYVWKVHEDKDKIVVFLLYLVPSLTLATIYHFSIKYKKLANIYGIALYLSYAITLLVAYVADQIPFKNEQVVNQLQVSIVIFLVIYGGFFNLRVAIDVPARIICLFLIATTLIMMFH